MNTAAAKTVLAVLGVTAALGLSACSSNANANAGSGAAATAAPTSAGRTAGANRAAPGTSGLIAAVTGTTMQVQSRTEQVAVTWTGTTTFTQQVTGSLADVTVGSCITAMAAQTGATPATDAAAPTALTAATVQIRPSTNGSCTAGFGGQGAGGGQDGATAPTRTGPTGGSGGGSGGGTGNGQRGFAQFGTSGQVTAVSGDTITVTPSTRPGASATTAPVAVTTTGSTVYLKTAAATAGDVKVGECATALGKADSTGAVTATAVSLRPATNGECTTGFGGGRRGPGSTASATATANG